jgi:hypothetical protein
MANMYGMNQNACPQCGFQLGAPMQPYGFQGYAPNMGYGAGMGYGYGSPWAFNQGYGYSPAWGSGGWGLGGLRTWGGTYSPQFTATGLPTDEEITEMVYDALDDDMLVPWDADINVDVKAGEVTLTGTVPNKRIKHSAGDDTWWVPGVIDVHNELSVSGRHRYRSEQASGMQASQGQIAQQQMTQPQISQQQQQAGRTRTSARGRGQSQSY